MIGKICGTGAYAPPNVMKNDDLANLVETSDEWIRERTGIARRHIAQEENIVDMAVKSAERALKNAKISFLAKTKISFRLSPVKQTGI